MYDNDCYSFHGYHIRLNVVYLSNFIKKNFDIFIIYNFIIVILIAIYINVFIIFFNIF